MISFSGVHLRRFCRQFDLGCDDPDPDHAADETDAVVDCAALVVLTALFGGFADAAEVFGGGLGFLVGG